MMILTMVVWVYMYARRISLLNSLEIEPNELTPARLAEISPPGVANPSDNLKNLFEVPVLFYALCLYLHTTGEVDLTYLTAAWIFVALRGLHSVVHCTVNVILVRFYIYAASTLTLWFILLQATIQLFGL